MDFSKASSKELYQIAMDASNRLKDRYKAAAELQRRKHNEELCRMIDIQKDENRWF